MKEIKELRLSNNPHIHARSVMLNEDKDKIKDKNRKQFITCNASRLTVTFTPDDTKLVLYAPKGYKFDGATIPFNIGKGNMKLLIPALYHDILCDNKNFVDYDRNLASRIFKAALISCGVNKATAQVMYLAVEAYQKMFGKWRKKVG
mgnify:CR=1 FL=1